MSDVAEQLTFFYFECYNDGLIKDNPALCLRWLFGTCPNNRRCAEVADATTGYLKGPCDHYTQRADEAVLVIKKKD